MLRSFLLITFRILWRNKVTSVVNIFSLSVGITSFIFIMLYVHHEKSYDKFNENFSRIYRLEADDYSKLPPILGTLVNDKLPEVENATLLSCIGFRGPFYYSPENDPSNVIPIDASFLSADSTIFNVFSFPFLMGNPRTALQQPMTAVVTESTAKKLFGKDSPMGKVIKASGLEYIITGVIRDVKTSHFEVDIILSLSSLAKEYPDRNINNTVSSSWLWSATYLLMTGSVDEKLLEIKINEVLSQINDGTIIDTKFESFRIRPLKDIYFDGDTQKLSYGVHGNKTMIEILIAIGIFMLVLACINYINLSTARSFIRAKEVAIKQVAGSSANQLRFQLIVESIVVALIALVVAVTLVQFFLSNFKEIAAVDIQLFELNRPLIWLGMVVATIVVGVMAGAYPAFYLTAIRPVSLMKGDGFTGSGGSIFRSWLMTFQFALSIVMIVAIIVNFRQLQYTRNADLGFNKEQVIVTVTPDGANEYELRESFREKVRMLSGIENISFSYGGPAMMISDSPTLEINGVHASVKGMFVDPEYLNVMGMTVSQGRGFAWSNPGDRMKDGSGGIIVNETMIREFRIESPIGKRIYTSDKKYSAEIIGVVKDFHFRSFHDKIEPLMFLWYEGAGITASIKVASSDIPSTLKKIEAEFKNVWGLPFTYVFLDEGFNRQYKSDEQLATVIGYFTLLAVIIACLGLFALSSFMVSRRRKEIGIRKSLGASVGTIYSMLTWNFLKWILVALLVATPVAWFLMKLWLETFAYHIPLSADIFVLSGLMAATIALLTITWQSLKAANANPIKSLRYE